MSAKLRLVKPIPLPSLKLETVSPEQPSFKWIDPKELFIEGEYQRDLTKRSIKLIREIAKNFDWLHIKPPICAEGTDGKLCVIDGQHTAIAAASRGDIDKIPVMVVKAAELKQRARAFIEQNTHRLTMNALQIFHAKIVAGDEAALLTRKVAQAAGVTIAKVQAPEWEVGDTMAAGAIVRLVGRLGEEKATKALKVLVSAKRAPVVVHEILASAAVLFDAKFGWAHSAADLVTVVRSKSIDQWRRQVAAHSDVDHRMQLWKAVAQGWVRAGNRMAA